MKDKQKSLDDLDFLTELSMSEQEQISGGTSNDLTSARKPIIVGGRASLSPTPYVPPEDDEPLPQTIDPTSRLTF
ncbi:hypothetical protein H6G41_12405 [Tolypothrix sp. FACHB-123]|uniref:hypothetical protein n=1 Tax=Tolypothrix sp. FACHB-123 TaxID=2692868 RepID=UPI001689234A|nr:hypothetical protein [Tolypothrix sp. FACHB-123]MBD2355410.1 hypothetical protein [Tolypothrix sp. FACHB-123]